MTYKNWLYEWLENYVKHSTKARTHARYLTICSLHIIPSVGDIPLEKLSSVDLQKFITALLTNGNKKTGKGLSANCRFTSSQVIHNKLRVNWVKVSYQDRSRQPEGKSN